MCIRDRLLLKNCAVDFVEICNVCTRKMIIKAAKRIFNSDKICWSYYDFYFGVIFLDHTRSKSKPEIEFQYGGPPFPETGSSYISAADWAISSKFGMPIDLLLIHLNPEVQFRLYSRHLGNSIWRHNSAAYPPITTKFGKRMQNVMSITILSSKS